MFYISIDREDSESLVKSARSIVFIWNLYMQALYENVKHPGLLSTLRLEILTNKSMHTFTKVSQLM